MQRKAKLVDLLQSDDVKLFLKTHKSGDPVALALKYSGKVNFEAAPVIELLRIYQRATNKLPSWLKKGALFTRKSYEQASSELSAEWKVSQIEGHSILNLCAGIGVDDLAFASKFAQVISLELDEEVHLLAVFNLSLFEQKNIQRLNTSAEEYLSTFQGKFDWVYLDPDRRDDKRKVFGLEESKPDVIGLWSTLNSISENILVKASPMLEFKLVEEQVQDLNELQVIAIGGEVKEILLFKRKNKPKQKFAAIELQPLKEFRSNERIKLIAELLKDERYFYECNAALIKSELCASYLWEVKAKSLVSNSAFACSKELIPDFFGRSFEIKHKGEYSRKKFDRYLKECFIQKANLNRRNFKLKVDELRKTHKLKDGGSDYFFFFNSIDNKAYFVHGTKLSV